MNNKSAIEHISINMSEPIVSVNTYHFSILLHQMLAETVRMHFVTSASHFAIWK
jgi:hypothetical protein